LPDRFKKTQVTPFNFIPQGTGDHDVDHRCPGELFTIELMRTLVEYFVLHISYEIPDQNLQVQMDRLPALPVSHMKISNLVKRVPFFEIHI
jgi:fatty-acid peroxygenase